MLPHFSYFEKRGVDWLVFDDGNCAICSDTEISKAKSMANLYLFEKMLSWKSLSEAIVLSKNVSLKYSKLYNAKFANSDKLKIWPKFQSLVTVEPKFDTEFHFCLSRFWLKYKSAIKNLNVFLLETFVQIGALRRYWFETKLSWCSKTSNELLVSF